MIRDKASTATAVSIGPSARQRSGARLLAAGACLIVGGMLVSMRLSTPPNLSSLTADELKHTRIVPHRRVHKKGDPTSMGDYISKRFDPHDTLTGPELTNIFFVPTVPDATSIGMGVAMNLVHAHPHHLITNEELNRIIADAIMGAYKHAMTPSEYHRAFSGSQSWTYQDVVEHAPSTTRSVRHTMCGALNGVLAPDVQETPA